MFKAFLLIFSWYFYLRYFKKNCATFPNNSCKDPKGQSHPQNKPLPQNIKDTTTYSISKIRRGSESKTLQDGLVIGAVIHIKTLRIVICPPAIHPNHINIHAKKKFLKIFLLLSYFESISTLVKAIVSIKVNNNIIILFFWFSHAAYQIGSSYLLGLIFHQAV